MLQKICAFLFFRVFGWKVVGDPPEVKKYLFVVVPHTSNWDFVLGWLATKAINLDVKIFAKDVFFVWPLNYVCNWFGVLPVNRRKSTNFVDTVALMFDEADELAAVITPEGTRGYRPVLKSGYYHLAKKAGVPIVIAGPCFRRKIFTIVPPRAALESFEHDEDNVIEFCRDQIGKGEFDSFR